MDRSISGTDLAVSSSDLVRRSSEASRVDSRSESFTEVVVVLVSVEGSEVTVLSEAAGETQGSEKDESMGNGILQMGRCAARMNSRRSFSFRRLAISFCRADFSSSSLSVSFRSKKKKSLVSLILNSFRVYVSVLFIDRLKGVITNTYSL